MRLAILGAFPFPYPQGSQIYAAQQTRALEDAGAEVCLLSYGGGSGPARVPHRAIAESLAPRRHRSGFHWGKPAADIALLVHYLRQHRLQRFDLALAHNAEAAMIGLAARSLTGVPVLYVAHTLLRHELSAYGPARWDVALNAAGAAIDSGLARHADGILALSPESQQTLSPHARGPIRVLPPGLDPKPGPGDPEQARVCARHGLTPGQFTFYSGNLDRYQDLELLSGASELIGDTHHPVVIGTHDARDSGIRLGSGRARVQVVGVADFAEMRALTWAAHTLVLTRRRAGGFPVKLLNYMEAGRPIVAFEGIAVGLEHERSAWLLPARAGAAEFARAFVKLRRDPARAMRLGAGAKQHLEAHHAWPPLAAETLEFAREIAEQARSRPRKEPRVPLEHRNRGVTLSARADKRKG